MRISYGRTAYVNGCGAEMIDLLQNAQLPCTMKGEDWLQIDREDLISILDELNDKKEVSASEGFLRNYLNEVYNKIEGEFFSVMFIK
jgi:hypothetical protein